MTYRYPELGRDPVVKLLARRGVFHPNAAIPVPRTRHGRGRAFELSTAVSFARLLGNPDRVTEPLEILEPVRRWFGGAATEGG